jgi:beta propeller repeat protein
MGLLCTPLNAFAHAYPPMYGETRLTSSISGQVHPDIYGNRVVYQSDGAVFCYDLVTGATKKIPAPENVDSYGEPAISGSRVVYGIWPDDSAASGINCYDMQSGVTKHLSGRGVDPSISGNDVVWEDYMTDSIHWYDLSSSTLTTIATQWVGTPDVSDHGVVFNRRQEPWSDTPQDVIFYDLSTGTERLIGYGSDPVVRESYVLWTTMSSIQETSPVYGPYTRYVQSLVTNSPGGWSSPQQWLGPIVLASAVAYPPNRPIGPYVVAGESVDDVFYQLNGSIYSARTSDRLAVGQLGGATGTRVVYSSTRGGNTDVYLYETNPMATPGTPVTDTTQNHTRSYPVYGSLKPRHPVGTDCGKLSCDRYYSGRWHRVKEYRLTASNYRSYSRYNTRVRLSRAGRWRLRAAHYVTSNFPTLSAWREVTVR